MGNTVSSDPTLEDLYPLPTKYKVLNVLGEGTFGVVLECRDQDTKETVAIKISKRDRNLSQEARILKMLMVHNLDQKNIIKFYGGFWMDKCLVFEMLDINLSKYIRSRRGPMYLQQIRTVIQQLATAFAALKSIGVIHTDVKTNNIMLVDRVRQAFKVKLIDFGLAILKSEAKHVTVKQAPFFRAPEIMLDLPISEGLDMWSLGCVMAIMMFGFVLFPGRTDSELLQYMIDLLGLPPHHVINAGNKSNQYFRKKAVNQWIFKEYLTKTTTDKRCYKFRSLDEMKTLCLEKDNSREAEARRACIALLKAMLTWDDTERITPSEVLAHPFITMSYCNNSSHHSSWDETLEFSEAGSSPRQATHAGMSHIPELGPDKIAEPGTDKASELSMSLAAKPNSDKNTDSGSRQAQTGAMETTIRTLVDDNTHETHRPTSTDFIRVHPAASVRVILPSGLIMVQPAPPQNRIPLEETSDEDSISVIDLSASTYEDPNPDAASAPVLDNDSNHNTDESKKTMKKRKNCFRRLFSWFKKTFNSCCNVDNVLE